jgi:hypothetical protein
MQHATCRRTCGVAPHVIPTPTPTEPGRSFRSRHLRQFPSLRHGMLMLDDNMLWAGVELAEVHPLYLYVMNVRPRAGGTSCRIPPRSRRRSRLLTRSHLYARSSSCVFPRARCHFRAFPLPLVPTCPRSRFRAFPHCARSHLSPLSPREFPLRCERRCIAPHARTHSCGQPAGSRPVAAKSTVLFPLRAARHGAERRGEDAEDGARRGPGPVPKLHRAAVSGIAP